MKEKVTTVAAVVIMIFALSSSDLFADLKVTAPIKPWHVTEIAADTPRCDSPTTYSYNVTWKPVYETWNKLRAPSVWKSYVVQTYNCAETSIIICDALCTTRATGCSIKQATSWMRIATVLNDERTAKGSFMQISGVLRPPLTVVDRKLQCVN
ncbi:hypothetical protein [Nitrospira lenta]|uniref:Uncharacterized protein n=1 Tax=Nitrospira lenta TaxID=1436998 RepID=A0A330L300_9BACT|nr:hypothetical protein [Nitrospira lenta]SPP63232.1 exported hypothetical protein [Nitrospira lenta]